MCNLCNGAVQFVLRRDRAEYFRFASLQSNYGQSFLKQHGLDPGQLHSIILYEGGKIYQRSEAALRIGKRLRGFGFVSALLYVPRFLRDGVYNLIAHNRYRLFGKKDECMIPTPELRGRFVD